MPAQILDGKFIAQKVRTELKEAVAHFKVEQGFIPGLATILVGENPASQVYIRNKIKACEEVGMKSFHQTLSLGTSQDELLALIDKLNHDKKVHGILVQLPLPKQINEHAVLKAINPLKDVDGFSPQSMGALMCGTAALKPCTPFGVMRLLEETGIDLAGKNAVVLGRSNIVGKPVSLMLLEKNATVTICHSKTKNLPDVVRMADVVVAAIGKPQFVKGEWIKNGAIVIDVGINRLPDGSLVGDVDFKEAVQKASWITPVPGGVGPMTIAMLLKNTLMAATQSILAEGENY